MRKHRCPGGVKVARFPGMSEVSGSIPVSGLSFLLIFVVFTLCLPFYSSLLSACTVKRGAPSTASCLTHSLPYSNEPRQHYIIDHTILFNCLYYSRIIHEKT